MGPTLESLKSKGFKCGINSNKVFVGIPSI